MMGISSMAFRVACVRDFLSQHGYVVTVRGYNYKSENAVVPDLGNARIKRKKLGEIRSMKDIEGFVPLSGFKTARDWWRQIRQFCKGRMYLYRVQIDDDHISEQERRYEEKEQRTLFDDTPGYVVDRSRFRDWDDVTPAEEYNAYDNCSHALDIRSDPVLRDPALVDLSEYKATAHQDRLEAEARAKERRRERLRQRYEMRA